MILFISEPEKMMRKRSSLCLHILCLCPQGWGSKDPIAVTSVGPAAICIEKQTAHWAAEGQGKVQIPNMCLEMSEVPEVASGH